MRRRRILYVTGTRAEFGLMQSTFAAIQSHPRLELQLVVTGMHLSHSHGYTINSIRSAGWKIDATVPWRGSPDRATGGAIQKLAALYEKLNPDIVLVTGDRIEPFAAAVAARIGNRCVAHIHGGDRAQGQLDDSLRHAITKLANIHFPATRESAERIYRLGEERFRIHTVGTPGLDSVKELAARGSNLQSLKKPFVLVALHPDTADEIQQQSRAAMLFAAIEKGGFQQSIVIYPNNDPGWQGIARVLETLSPAKWICHRDLPRAEFLSCLNNASVLVGNSSSGIIEAASVGTPVINVGDRQRGRQRSSNVIDVKWNPSALTKAVRHIWNNSRPKRFNGRNVYGSGRCGERIASILSEVTLNDRLMNKLIRY